MTSALKLLAEWNPGVLPYIQDLPPRIRAIALDVADNPDSMWSNLQKNG